MSRAKTQRKRASGRKPLPAKSMPSHPAGVSKFGGTEDRDPHGGPKGPSDPAARVIEWK